MENLNMLSEKMQYKERQWPWGKMLKYITARQAQDRLDAVVWPKNWAVEYKEIAGNIFAWVSIRVHTEWFVDYNWITKWDAGSESNIEKEKGHISDSFKRACVCWGIGRFLYWELPWDNMKDFLQSNYDWFVTKKDNYSTAKEAIDTIKTVYTLPKEFEDKIILLYK